MPDRDHDEDGPLPDAPWPHDLLRDIYNAPETTRRVKRRIRRTLPPVTVDYRGCRMRVHPADNNTEFQIWRLGRTHEERALRDILARLSGGPFLAYDVGANAGSFSVRLAQTAPEGSRIRAFEPNPEMRARLEANLSLNRSDAVIVHDCAISDSAGDLELCFPDAHNLGQARLGGVGGSGLHVPVRPLTDFVRMDENRPLDFLKVDIEGLEDRAITPLLDSGHFPRLIFFEHKHSEHWQADITKRLRETGYDLAAEYGRNALFEL